MRTLTDFHGHSVKIKADTGATRISNLRIIDYTKACPDSCDDKVLGSHEVCSVLA